MKRLSHLMQLYRQAMPKRPQMSVKSAMLEKIRNRNLRQRGGRQRGHELQPLNRILETTGSSPADAVAGCKAFGKRTAVQDEPLSVEGLHRSGTCVTKIQLGVDIGLR